MEDSGIIRLYFARSEEAILETDRKYGPYCHRIAYNILTNEEDAQECVNDTYLAAWNRIPPQKPGILSAFLGKITRFLSIDRWRRRGSAKRGGGELTLALEELEDCVSGGHSPEDAYIAKEAAQALNRFLDTLPEEERNVFLRRYWYIEKTSAIAQRYGYSESKVTSMLHRTRGKLRAQFQKEGLL